MKKELNLNLIREKRLEHGFSNEEMAKSLGLASSDKYFRREHGIYKFQASELPALSKKLNIPLEKIFV
ncbi:MAG: XRE family transcriptional regulator [Lactobacillus kalixensis]|uniref:XRE family transcriptional regulator n=1 Tax=Lactobacillus kalixensis TaxID=227944 RepID=UPI003993662B